MAWPVLVSLAPGCCEKQCTPVPEGGYCGAIDSGEVDRCVRGGAAGCTG
ncbi:hypothetical protein Rhow_000848 [Rhodococcus wratislaviensis]|uniref:Uncharacterized protein n=1 Tax=Rhodococcus wratislaviensis TaxID=44752 RepID=A0A402C2U7_RHOWR|nr:hypothetical protein Rhow_000848 [Rhodococcus wratislaviensis]